MEKITCIPILEPARIITSPGGQYSLEHRLWQGCPTIARTPGGRLWAGWYSGGPKEPDELNYNIYAYTISADQGSTWSRHYGAVKVMNDGHNFDETMVVELQGNLLWMLARTRRGALAQSFSYGSSNRWTPSGLSELKSPSSRFWIGRLASGRLLLINHLNFTGRSHLTALLSEDEGHSWPYSLLLDGRENVSYPDAIEYPDGKIACVHDYMRVGIGEINLSFFREEDIMAGKPVSADCILSRRISGIEPVRY